MTVASEGCAEDEVTDLGLEVVDCGTGEAVLGYGEACVGDFEAGFAVVHAVAVDEAVACAEEYFGGDVVLIVDLVACFKVCGVFGSFFAGNVYAGLEAGAFVGVGGTEFNDVWSVAFEVEGAFAVFRYVVVGDEDFQVFEAA